MASPKVHEVPRFPKPMHEAEAIVQAITERFWRDFDLMVEWGTVGDRPLFSVPLTPAEQLQRFQFDRETVLSDARGRGGPEEVLRTLERIRGYAGRVPAEET